MPANTPTTGTGSDDSDDTATGKRAREREPRPVRERAGEEDVVEDREPRAAATGAARYDAGCVSKNGAAIASGSQPASIIHPDSVFCAIGGFHLRSSTVPIAHRIAAHRMRSAPIGVERMWRMSSPSSTTIAEHAEDEPDDLAPVERLVQHDHRDERRPDRHRVRDDRAAPGGQLLHAEQHERVPARDVEEREHEHAPPPFAGNADGIAAQARDEEHADRRERQRQRAKRERRDLLTPIFSTGQLQPHTRVRIAMGTKACASGWRCAISARAREAPRRTSTDAARAPASPRRRGGCARETRPGARRTRRCRARSSARSGDTSRCRADAACARARGRCRR